MTRARHAMRVHPLRSKGVVVGVPIAAAVAFGAHTMLGVTPLSDQHDAQPSTSASSAAAGTGQAGAPVQSYGLAATPPPTTLGLLSAPSTQHGSAGHVTGSTGSAAGSSTSSHAGAPAQTVPITAAAGTPASSMMTFTPARAPAAAPVPAASAASAAPAATQHATPQVAQRAATPAPTTASAQDDGGSADGGSSGGSLVGVDLGVAKVSLLSFGG